MKAGTSDAKWLAAPAGLRMAVAGAVSPTVRRAGWQGVVSRSARHRTSGFFVWITLLALLLQSFLVETHIHGAAGDADALSSITRSAASVIAAEKPAPGQHSLCPLCAEMALSGHYIATTPIILIPPVAAEFWLYPAIAIQSARREAAHHWQSRAPPSDLRI